MKRALLVGIDQYDNFEDLGGAVNDLNALAPLIGRNEDGEPNFECQKRAEGVTRDGLLRDLEKLLDGAGDLALFYFAGHGSTNSGQIRLARHRERNDRDARRRVQRDPRI